MNRKKGRLIPPQSPPPPIGMVPVYLHDFLPYLSPVCLADAEHMPVYHLDFLPDILCDVMAVHYAGLVDVQEIIRLHLTLA